MPHDMELDGILATLACEVTPQASDLLLELRDAAASPDQAGTCVRLYFALLESAPDGEVARVTLGQLRKWLENHLKLEVVDEERRLPLENLPLRLAGATNLASFCHGAMAHLRNDRCHSAKRLRIQIGFSRSPVPSA